MSGRTWSPESGLTTATRNFDKAIQAVLEQFRTDAGASDFLTDSLAITLASNPAMCSHLGETARRYVLARAEHEERTR